METLRSALPALQNTVIIYVLLIIGIRTLGRRQTGQLTALDLLIVLLLGSAVETSLIGPAKGSAKGLFHDPNVSLLAGIVSASTLLVINRLFGWLMSRSRRMRHLLSGGPLLLVHNGKYVQENLRRAGMTDADMLHALRGSGFAAPEEVCFALLEPNGEIHALERHAPVLRKPPTNPIAREFELGSAQADRSEDVR